MAYIPGQLSKSSSSSGQYVPGSLKKKKKEERTTEDISTTEKLIEVAESRGLKVKEKKPSLFRRSLDVLSRPLFASANLAKDAIDGGEFTPLKSLSRGITGKDKTTYSDVLGEAGVENKYIKGGAGFILDVALDPTTYFGGTAIKFAGKGLGLAGKTAFKAGAKAAPETFGFIEAAGKNLQDAFGTAFKYGYGTSKGLADDVTLSLNKLGIAKNEIIEGNVNAFSKGFTKDELTEAGEIMIKNRKAEYASRSGKKVLYSKSKNPKVNELTELFKKKAVELAEKAGIPLDKAYKNYFPFLDETKLAGKTTPLTALSAPEGSSPLSKSGGGYLKEFKNLIEDDNLLKKPIEAYTRREYQVVRDKTVTDTLNTLVKTYGKGIKDFDSIDDAIKAGYVTMKDRKFGKVVGYLKESDAKFINDYLYPEFKSIDVLAKASGYDAFTALFKKAVTAYFPSFHIRNYISGNIQNYQTLGVRALAPSNVNSALSILKGTNKNLKLGGKIYNSAALKKELTERFGGSSRYISDIGDYIEEIAGNNFRVKPISKARQFGNFIEMNQKAVATVTALKQGKTLKEALNLAEKAGFDYSRITKFESSIMRRLIPFYTFARKNADLQLSTLVNNPARIINQAKMTDALSTVFGGKTTEEDMKGLPPWVLEGLGFKVKGNKYISQFGLPLEEHISRWNRPLMSTLTSLNPLIRYPLEAKLGFDFFREQKLVDINKVAPATGEILMKAKESGKLPEWFDEFLNIGQYTSDYDGKTRYTASPQALHIIRNLPTSRIESTLEKIFDKDIDKINKWTAFFSGAKVYDINIEQQKFFNERDLQRDIQDQLMNRGIGDNFESFYIRK